MERRSEIAEGLELLRESILGYDAAADPKGLAWDELRIELDRSVLGLIEKANGDPRFTPVLVYKVYGATVHLDALGNLVADTEVRHVMGVDLATSPDATGSVVMESPAPRLEIANLDAWTAFRRDLPATWDVAGPAVIARGADIDIGAMVKGSGFEVWGESARGRDFIAAKLRVRARIGKHYRVGRAIEAVKCTTSVSDLVVVPTPYLVGKGPADVDEHACLVTPLTEHGSIWLQNQAADGVQVLRNGIALAEAEAVPNAPLLLAEHRMEAAMERERAARFKAVHDPGAILDPKR